MMRLLSFGGRVKVNLEPGEPTFAATIGGAAFYSSNGRQLVRQKVTPVHHSTAASKRETAGITAGSKAWANLLTPAERAAWEVCTFGGLTGFWLWAAIWSIWQWIWETLPPILCPIVPPPVVEFGDVAFDPTVPSLVVTLNLVSGNPDCRGWVAVSGASSPGRTPTVKAARTIAIGIVPGVATDLTAEYLERFGVFPAVGSVVRLTGRVISPSSTAFSEIVTAVVVSAVSVTVEMFCVPASLTQHLSPFAPIGLMMDVTPSAPGASWSVVVLTAGFVWMPGPPSGPNGVYGYGGLRCVLGNGSYTVEFLFTASGGETGTLSVGMVVF